MWFTVWQAAVSTALTLAVALPAAHVLARYEFRGPPPRAGPGHGALRAADRRGRLRVRGPARPTGPLGVGLDGTVWAILIAHAFFNYAVVVRMVGGLWEQLDPTTGGGGPGARRLAADGGPHGHPPGAATRDRVRGG